MGAAPCEPAWILNAMLGPRAPFDPLSSKRIGGARATRGGGGGQACAGVRRRQSQLANPVFCADSSARLPLLLLIEQWFPVGAEGLETGERKKRAKLGPTAADKKAVQGCCPAQSTYQVTYSDMARWAALGLHILTVEADADPRGKDHAILSIGGVQVQQASDAGDESRELLPPPPLSPRTQALLDSDVLCTLLASTVERCLDMVEDPHASPFRTETAEDAAHVRQHGQTTFDEDDASSHTSDTSTGWPLQHHPENSPTSAIWGEWDSTSPPQVRSESKKRRREECDGEEPYFDTLQRITERVLR